MLDKNKIADANLENVNGGHTDVWILLNGQYYRVAAMPGKNFNRDQMAALAKNFRPASGEYGYDYSYFSRQWELNDGPKDISYLFERKADGSTVSVKTNDNTLDNRKVLRTH